jgi:hypothetical protein
MDKFGLIYAQRNCLELSLIEKKALKDMLAGDAP